MSETMSTEQNTSEKMSTEQSKEVATLAGGCFWCLEAVYKTLRGVTGVVSGYAGGDVLNPTYYQVCEGTTGHAEVVQITFDPRAVTAEGAIEERRVSGRGSKRRRPDAAPAQESKLCRGAKT